VVETHDWEGDGGIRLRETLLANSGLETARIHNEEPSLHLILSPSLKSVNEHREHVLTLGCLALFIGARLTYPLHHKGTSKFLLLN
jgi:hypothetical protein